MTSQVVYFQIDILRPSRVHRSEGGLLMSVVGQKQTFRNVRAMSALPPKADIDGARWNVCFGPEADIPTEMKRVCFAPARPRTC
jgi:hypothetical protein